MTMVFVSLLFWEAHCYCHRNWVIFGPYNNNPTTCYWYWPGPHRLNGFHLVMLWISNLNVKWWFHVRWRTEIYCWTLWILQTPLKAIKSNPIRPHSRKRNYTPAGFKRLFPHGKKYRLQYDDDEGILLDGCVTRLKKYNLEEYELIIAHFVIGISLRTIAKKRNVLMALSGSNCSVRQDLLTGLYTFSRNRGDKL